MIVYQSPGVYIQEVPAGPQPIAAAPTSVLAVIGTTERGPLREPTRVTGWTDFRATFGLPVEGGHLAEAVYGYFENGGPAVYVVRADPSTAASWSVQRQGGGEAFRLVSASPGAWANGLRVEAFPDYSAGGGRLYVSDISAVAAKVVTVASTAGIGVGDSVQVVQPSGAAAATKVTAVDSAARTVTLDAAPGAVAGKGWLVAVLPKASKTIGLASGGGIKAGDVVTFLPATRVAETSTVTKASQVGAGLALEVAAARANDVPAAAFGPRIERFTATVASAPGGTALPFAALTGWAQNPAPAAAAVKKGYRATSSTGVVGEASADTGPFTFKANVPAGRVEVEAVVMATKYSLTGSWVNPTLATITEQFGFLPAGTSLKLSAGADTVTLKREATPDGWSGGNPSTKTWTQADFVAPASGADGVLVTSAFEPLTTDFLGTAAITSVERIGTDLYFVRTAAGAIGDGPYTLQTLVPTQVVPRRFGIAVTDDTGTEVERFTGLAMEATHPRYYLRDTEINGVSKYIRVNPPAAGAITDATMPAFATRLGDGANQVASAADLMAAFALLERESEPAILACPDAVELSEADQAGVIGQMITHCEEFRRFAVVDAPRGLTDTKLADWRQRNVNSMYAATYAPWVKILNLDPKAAKREINVPPSGFVAGVFARTDRERGVHKAPANERVRGIVGLADDFTQRRQDLLNPSGVNLIRTFPGRGIRIWGARNATDDVQWRYVNVRRLFNFIETSVERSTQWVVFEPNTASTWLRIRVSVENFLDQLWRSGALAGTAPEQAYRVRVGLGETMTETDIDLGLVVTEVAVAPAKPAEFVVFRFSHKRITE